MRPDSTLVYSDSLASCEKINGFVPDQAGAYTLIVGFGHGGGEGSFVVGIGEYPTPAAPVLCNDLDINPLANNFPIYYVTQNVTVPGGDTLVIQEGVGIEFYGGAHFISSGWIRGMATPAAPIRLRPEGAPSPRSPTPNYTANELER